MLKIVAIVVALTANLSCAANEVGAECKPQPSTAPHGVCVRTRGVGHRSFNVAVPCVGIEFSDPTCWKKI